MTLQASGPISFSQIANEFGITPGKNLGAYRISQLVTTSSNPALNLSELTRPLDDGIPISGPIGFGSFYSKKLNIVVYCSGNRVIASSLYNNNTNVTVIGGYKTRPTSSSGCKVWIYTNETIGSNIPASLSSNNLYCSLITGGFDADTDLRLDIGPSGFVSGAGGNGGNGGAAGCSNGSNGVFGTSAIGVNYQPIIITNRGNIRGGSGGGGGGGGAYGENRRSRRRDIRCYAGGGGGGGGSGIPGGSGGGAGGGTSGLRAGISAYPSSGDSGSAAAQGAGGVGGVVSGRNASAQGGAGGSGGAGGNAGNGAGFNNLFCDPVGGSQGTNGYGIIITNDGTGVTITNTGTLIGGTVVNTSIS